MGVSHVLSNCYYVRNDLPVCTLTRPGGSKYLFISTSLVSLYQTLYSVTSEYDTSGCPTMAQLIEEHTVKPAVKAVIMSV